MKTGFYPIAKDKVLHLVVNFALAMTGFWNWFFALGLCLGASFGKEYGDSKAPGNKWDWLDILADLIGMGFGLLIVYIVKGGF